MSKPILPELLRRWNVFERIYGQVFEDETLDDRGKLIALETLISEAHGRGSKMFEWGDGDKLPSGELRIIDKYSGGYVRAWRLAEEERKTLGVNRFTTLEIF